MNILAVTLVIGASLMGNDPSADPGLSGLVFAHNEQGGLRAEWKFGTSGYNQQCCLANDTEYATSTFGVGFPAAPTTLYTKGHGLSLAPGLYRVTLIIDGFTSDVDYNVPCNAVYINYGYHVGSVIQAQTKAYDAAPHNEQGRVTYTLPFVIDASVLNSPQFGVCFSGGVANDSACVMRLNRVGVLAEKVD